LNIITITIRAGSFRNNLTIGMQIMNKQGEFTKNGAPLLDGKNYAFWSIIMRAFCRHEDLMFGKL
jgi:hypothetical protein